MLSSTVVQSPEELRGIAPQWNALWTQSEGASPACRAEPLALFHELIETDGVFKAIAIWDGPELVAATPFSWSPRMGVLRTARLSNSEWAQCGTLLIGKKHLENQAVFACLVEELRRLKIGMLELDWLNSRNAWVGQLAVEMKTLDCQVLSRDRFSVGWIELPSTWEQFLQNKSKNRRTKIRQAESRLAAQGVLQLVAAHDARWSNVESDIRAALEIEDQSWKGKKGSSLKTNPNIERFYIESARHLFENNLFRLYLLKLGDETIAFDLGYEFNGTYWSVKISYLPCYAAFSPGNVLNGLLLRHMIDQQTVKAIDCVGPITDSVSQWCTSTYRSQRLQIAIGGWFANSSLTLKKWLHSSKDLLRSRSLRSALTREGEDSSSAVGVDDNSPSAV